MNTSTIYLLTNKINNKVYVGQTWLTLSKRMGKDGSNYNNSVVLYNAIKAHGAENFEYTTLYEAKSQWIADAMEDFYIRKYNSRDLNVGYNLKEGGSVGKHSEATKAQISETLKNKEWSPEALAAKALGGKQWLGKIRGPQSEEKKQHNSEFFKQWHQENEHPMQGKNHTEKTKEKMSAATKKLWEEGKLTPEAIKLANLKKKTPKEKELKTIEDYLKNNSLPIQEQKSVHEIAAQNNIGTTTLYRILKRHNIPKNMNFGTWTGKTHTEETKAKMAAKRSEYWENKNIDTNNE